MYGIHIHMLCGAGMRGARTMQFVSKRGGLALDCATMWAVTLSMPHSWTKHGDRGAGCRLRDGLGKRAGVQVWMSLKSGAAR